MSTVNNQRSIVNKRRHCAAFTVIEILLVMGIFAILAGFTTINLLKPQTSSALQSTTTTLAADIKEQQIKAMVGDGEGTGTAQTYGVQFETNRYILFRDTPANPDSFTIDLEKSLTFTSLPQQILFTKRSGQTSPTSISIQHNQTAENKTLTINQYGAIDIN